jgi:hypothetical protein
MALAVGTRLGPYVVETPIGAGGMARTTVRYSYDLSADGQRLLVNSDLQASASSPITLVVSWASGPKK